MKVWTPAGDHKGTFACPCCGDQFTVEYRHSDRIQVCFACGETGCDLKDGICQRDSARPPMPADCLLDDPRRVDYWRWDR